MKDTKTHKLRNLKIQFGIFLVAMDSLSGPLVAPRLLVRLWPVLASHLAQFVKFTFFIFNEQRGWLMGPSMVLGTAEVTLQGVWA